MDRRTFIATVGTGLAAATAGCTQSESDDDGTGGGAGGDGNTTDTEEPTTEPGTTESATSTDEPTSDETTTSPTENDTETGEGTDEGTTAGAAGVADTAFEVTGRSCGSGGNTATVSTGDSTVTVEGSIGAPSGCYTARLGSATVEDGTLTVAVERYIPESEEKQACVDCLYDVKYTADVTVDSDLPSSVVVTHGDEQVTETSTN